MTYIILYTPNVPLNEFFDINKVMHNTVYYFRLFNKDRFKILDKGSKVRITNVSAEDNGIYSCHAKNVAGAHYSSEDFLLNVKGRVWVKTGRWQQKFCSFSSHMIILQFLFLLAYIPYYQIADFSVTWTVLWAT